MTTRDDVLALPVDITGGSTTGINDHAETVHIALKSLVELLGATTFGGNLVRATDAGAARTLLGAATATEVIDTIRAGAPAALDTLDELAAALGDNASYAATITTALSQKLTTPSGGSTGQVLTKTSGGFDWSTVSGGGSGTPGRGFTPRGAWAASTAYAVDDIVTNGGNTYRVTTAHTSPASFTTANLELWAQKGDTGQQGPPGSGSASVGWISVKDYGAVGDGSANDTTAVANAYQACVDAAIGGHPKALYFPSGWYRVTALPAFQNYSAIIGDGQRATTILYEGTGTLCTLTNRQEVVFRHLGFWATGAGSTTLDLSGCFSVYVDDVCFRGQHTSGSGSTYRTQCGVNIRDNTGNTQFHHCNWNNLGIGLRTRTIQNHVAQSKFAYCYQSIIGTGNNANAGLNLVEVEFDSAKDATTTSSHIYIDGSANEWNLVSCWFEGGNKACIVGVAGTGGPSSFKVFGGKMASRATYLEINHCAKTLLAGTEFNPDQQTPAGTNEVAINATYAPRGMAQMLMTTTSGRTAEDIPRTLFPSSWTVIDSAGIRGTVVAP